MLYLILVEFTMAYSTVDSNYKFLIHKFSFYTFHLHPSDLHFYVGNQEKLNYLDLKRYARPSLPDFSGIYS